MNSTEETIVVGWRSGQGIRDGSGDCACPVCWLKHGTRIRKGLTHCPTCSRKVIWTEPPLEQ